ncbi:MAG: L,D-transpeptidase family protein [Armatimonadetes bacterium]|nr:L,D-transpeptidase family protein [Armatimonadota bacterium]
MQRFRSLLVFVGAFAATAAWSQNIEGVTFANKPGQVFAPLRQTCQSLGLVVEWDDTTSEVVVGEKRFKERDFRTLFDGTKLVPLRDLEKFGVTVHYDDGSDSAVLSYQDKETTVSLGQKRVEISIDDQTLRAWQGQILVMETNVSTGRRGHTTPKGSFKAGPVKTRMHYSRLYDNAPMPYSVQVNGDVFIHGYHSVPKYPASHGCIRMPLYGRNAARYFFDWVDKGTPVDILGDFAEVSAKSGNH